MLLLKAEGSGGILPTTAGRATRKHEKKRGQLLGTHGGPHGTQEIDPTPHGSDCGNDLNGFRTQFFFRVLGR